MPSRRNLTASGTQSAKRAAGRKGMKTRVAAGSMVAKLSIFRAVRGRTSIENPCAYRRIFSCSRSSVSIGGHGAAAGPAKLASFASAAANSISS
jgi:hypothetical protein